MAETEEKVELEEAPEAKGDERSKLIAELIAAFLPDLGKDVEKGNFMTYFLACEEAMKKRINAYIEKEDYIKAYLLTEMFHRIFTQGILYEKTSGYSVVRVTFNRREGSLVLDTADDRKVLILGKRTAAQMIQDFLYKIKEVIDPDDFLFI